MLVIASVRGVFQPLGNSAANFAMSIPNGALQTGGTFLGAYIAVGAKDPEIGIEWPIAQPVLSAKDAAALRLADAVVLPA